MNNGKLVVLEGIDGSGTSTQVELLASYLKDKGKKVLVSKEPTEGPIGSYVRSILKKNLPNEQNLIAMLALSFAADRMEHIYKTIHPALKIYDYILLDRYVLSSFVYQGLDLPLAFIEEINRYAIKPDITILLDVDIDVAMNRIKERGQEKDYYEDIVLLTRVKKSYMELAKKADSIILDGNLSKEKVLGQIIYEIESKNNGHFKCHA